MALVGYKENVPLCIATFQNSCNLDYILGDPDPRGLSLAPIRLISSNSRLNFVQGIYK